MTPDLDDGGYKDEINNNADYTYEEEPYDDKVKVFGKFDYSKQDFQMLRKAIESYSPLRLSFYFLDYILRAQTALFEQINTQQELPRIIISMSILCAFLSAIYGATMGMSHSIFLTLSSAIKLPILFLLTAIICIPSLYTFNVLLASLAPLSFFFVLTTKNYSFLLLMHVAILGLCGAYGVQYLYRGCSYIAFRMNQPLNKLLLRIWIGIYAVVGMQLGWRLRPFVGTVGSPFELLRSDEDGNFYIAVWSALMYFFSGRSS